MNGVNRHPVFLSLAISVVLAGCGNKEAPQKSGAPMKMLPVEYFHVDPATEGSLSGRITFEGAKPARTVISMTSEAGCEQAHAGHPVYDEPVLIGKDKGLANAFVYIKGGLEGKNFPLPSYDVK